MRISTSKTYDTIIIGAGIAGCCTAYFLQEKGQNVLVVDRSAAVASGGSGAAGAFVSPKIGKGGSLHQLTNEAFLFAKDFYLKHFPEHFSQTGVIRIPKDDEDATMFSTYEEFNDPSYQWADHAKLNAIGIHDTNDSFLFPGAGVCDAQGMCRAILGQVKFQQIDVERVVWDSGSWTISTKPISPEAPLFILAKNIVLATGYQNELFDMRYMGVRGTWGSRGDYCSNLPLKTSMHKRISVSANIEGVVKIGATHVKDPNPCVTCDGEPLKDLFEVASQMVETGDFKLKETFCGMRAGSKDYFPLVGSVIDVPHMLAEYPAIVRGAKPPLSYKENLFVCNGLGGRGFVFAPLMGKILAEYIVDGVEIDKRVDSDRLFLKWCRKAPELER